MAGPWRRLAEGPARAGWLAGAVAGLLVTLAMALGRLALMTPLVPEILAEAVFAWVPMGLFRLAIGLFGDFAKTLAFAAAVGAQLFALAAAGAVYGLYRRAPRAALPEKRWLSAAGLGAAAWLAAGLAVLPAAGAGWFGTGLRSPPGLPPGFSTLLLFLGYGALVEALFPWALRRTAGLGDAVAGALGDPAHAAGTADVAVPAVFSRRRFLARLGLGAAGALGLVGLARGIQALMHAAVGNPMDGPPETAASGGGGAPGFRVRGLSAEVTPNADFYVVSKNLQDPLVDEAAWRLRVDGLVGRPLVLDRRALRRFQMVEQYQTLECISNPVGGDLISNAHWRGVRLREILEAAGGMGPGAVKVVLHAEDNYSDSIPVDRALDEATVLALEMNGQPLPPEHGFPARLLVPGLYGIKNVKWLNRVEVVDYDYKGYWQVRGWSDEGAIKTMSRIDVPRHRAKVDAAGATLAGVAFAGTRGITVMELSPDGGRTWLEARVKQALGPFTWQLWVAEWRPPASGSYAVRVRATDGAGEVQTAEVRPSLPEGATGHHTITLRVTG